MYQHKYRAWVFDRWHRLIINQPNGRNEWGQEWVMGEVKAIYFSTNKARVLDGSVSSKYHDYTIGDECILMAWSNLVDKYGTEIYESDLITKGDGRIWEVRHRLAPVGFGLVWVNEKKKKFDGRLGRFTTSMMDYQMADMEVIGNIYQNPELFKQ